MESVPERIVYIYALIDPNTDEIRYIGMTVEPKRRLYVHLRARTDTYRDRWIRALCAEGRPPSMRIIEETTSDQAAMRERHWITAYRAQEAPLTNGTDGGDGTLGRIVTDEVRAKIATTLKGKPHTDERRQHLREAAKHKTLPADFGARISTGLKGHAVSEQAREKHRQRLLGTKRDPAVGRKVRAALAGRTLNAQVKAKISAAKIALGNNAVTDGTRQKISEKNRREWADGKHAGHGDKMRAYWAARREAKLNVAAGTND